MKQHKKFNAVAVTLPSGRQLFAFPIDGKKIPEIASVTRVQRTEEGQLEGFQRDVVKRHIQEIARYIATPDAMIPNAIVIAFSDKGVRFIPSDKKSGAENGVHGVLEVPVSKTDDETDRSGWIVDGQQRTFAIGEAQVDIFPVMVCAFVEPDQEAQAQQFVNVNSTKALPKTLINELLPHLKNVPERLNQRRAAAILAERLAFDKDSPFKGLIKSATSKKGVLQLNSLIQPLETMLNNSHTFLGEQIVSGRLEGDIGDLTEVLKEYWRAVKGVFPDAWGLKPTESRLMHGVGVWAMTHLMDYVIKDIDGAPASDVIAEKLNWVEPFCHWTADGGDWEDVDGFGRVESWNSFQNTAQDKRVLTDYLLRKYREVRDV